MIAARYPLRRAALSTLLGLLLVCATALGSPATARSAATVSTIAQVKDINLHGMSSTPLNLADVNGTLFFAAYDPRTGSELWKSDGTAEGTVLFKALTPSSAFPDPFNQTNVNGTLFFVTTNGTNIYALWQSDGTTAGTMPITNINPGLDGSAPSQLTNVSGRLFLVADNGSSGAELWRQVSLAVQGYLALATR